MYEGEFSIKLKAYPPTFQSRSSHMDLEEGNKILLPPFCLQKIMDLCKGENLPYPLLFSISIADWEGRECIAGVLDFTAPEGTVICPNWMITTLFCAEGDRVNITNVTLNRGKSLKIQPLKYAFTELKNPKAILENELSKHYVSLTENEAISIKYSGTLYEFNILETKPDPSICILNCDLNVDFAPPVESPPKGPDTLELDQIIDDIVPGNQYKYYVFEPHLEYEKSSFTFEVEALSGDPDLYISQEEKKPNRYEHTWSSASTGGESLTISSEDIHRNSNKRYYISIRGHKNDSKFKLTVFLEKKRPQKGLPEEGFSLKKSGLRSMEDLGPEGCQKCDNCHQWVSEMNYQRHIAFCSRNNWRCPNCSKNVKVNEKHLHWHCPKCNIITEKEFHFSCDKCLHCFPLKEKEKHFEISHTPLICFCGQKFELEQMLVHKKFDCSFRKESCQWCQEFLAVNELKEHEESCGSISTKCGNCGKLVARKLMSDHNFQFHDWDESFGKNSGIRDPNKNNNNNNLKSSHSFLTQSAFSCPVCGFNAVDIDSLMEHIQRSQKCNAAIE